MNNMNNMNNMNLNAMMNMNQMMGWNYNMNQFNQFMQMVNSNPNFLMIYNQMMNQQCFPNNNMMMASQFIPNNNPNMVNSSFINGSNLWNNTCTVESVYTECGLWDGSSVSSIANSGGYVGAGVSDGFICGVGPFGEVYCNELDGE